MRILQYSAGSTIAIIGFAIWPNLISTQLLNHATKTQVQENFSVGTHSFLPVTNREIECRGTPFLSSISKMQALFSVDVCSSLPVNVQGGTIAWVHSLVITFSMIMR